LIFASSGNSRGSEGVANAIDNNKNTKYLNWDSGRDGNQIGTFSPSGFAVQPAVVPRLSREWVFSPPMTRRTAIRMWWSLKLE